MHKPQKINEVTLTVEERALLEKNTRSGNWSPREVMRAQILLLADNNGPDALTDEQIAQRLGCTSRTIVSRRKRFTEVDSIEEAITDKSRSGRPTIVDGRIDAHVTKIACSDPPKGRVKWTLELIRDRVVTLEIADKISRQTISRHLKKKSLSLG